MQTWTNSQPMPWWRLIAPGYRPVMRPHGADPAELLDIEVDQFTRVLALIAADRLSRLQRGQPVQAKPVQDTADGCRRDAEFGGDLLAGPTLAAQGLDLLDNGCRGWLAQTVRPR